MTEPTFTALTVTPAEGPRPSPPQLHRVYRGGFSSSICDLFANPYDRSSCCSLICCGICLGDRNQYALRGYISHPWWQRALALVAVVVSTLVVAVVIVLLKVNVTSLVFLVALAAPSVVLSIICTVQRAKFRREIKEKLEQDGLDARDMEEYPESCCSEERKAHRCCAFVPKDIMYHQQPPNQNYLSQDENSATKDSCTSLWNFIALSCCGCCGCWCNWCGMCAIGQEHRQLRRLLPPERFAMDYITFQPYCEFAPAIETLRRHQSANFREHLDALSNLASNLLQFLLGSLLVLVVVSSLHVFKHFEPKKLLVVLGTLFQALVVMYLVHWRSHKLDLSLDAVIKLFASGFFLATSIAMGIETIVTTIGNLVFTFLITFQYIGDNPDADFEDSEDAPTSEEILDDIKQKHVLTIIFLLFFQSFVVAGLVEELAKYFCFWAIEHPDFDSPPSGDMENTPAQNVLPRSIHSRAAATTVGMVSTAAGFACCENLMYSLGLSKSFKLGTFYRRVGALRTSFFSTQ